MLLLPVLVNSQAFLLTGSLLSISSLSFHIKTPASCQLVGSVGSALVTQMQLIVRNHIKKLCFAMSYVSYSSVGSLSVTKDTTYI